MRQGNNNAVPKLKPATQQARRESILDAAETCFARSGFHRTTMQDICREAGVSPGALYLYFSSKEGLIAGICDRERAIFETRIQMLAAAPDFLAAIEKIAQHYFVETSVTKRLVAVEMGVEATRNPQVAVICRDLDQRVTDAFRGLFQRLADERRITPSLSIEAVTNVFLVIGDGLFWRRAVVPNYDAANVIPGLMSTLHDLLKPVTSVKSRPVRAPIRAIPSTPAGPSVSSDPAGTKSPASRRKQRETRP